MDAKHNYNTKISYICDVQEWCVTLHLSVNFILRPSKLLNDHSNTVFLFFLFGSETVLGIRHIVSGCNVQLSGCSNLIIDCFLDHWVCNQTSCTWIDFVCYCNQVKVFKFISTIITCTSSFNYLSYMLKGLQATILWKPTFYIKFP